VAFHHDVYGSGVLHSNRTGANLRIITAPLMDEFNIDLVFTGHDHSYARSYSMLDGTAIKTSSNHLVNPYGTTYVTLGSSSGSKMYGLASPKQYYVKERSNDLTPTFSTLSVSDDTLLLKTYNSSGKQYSSDFSITKTTDKTNPVSTYQKTNALKKTSYTKKSFSELQNALTEFKQKFAPTKTDSGIAKIQKGYGTSSDPLTYYGYMLGTTDVLSKGFSTLLDKTRYQGGKAINQTTLTNLTLHLENARNALVKTTLVVKKGKKKLKSGQTISLKKGKKLKLKVTKTPSKYKVTYTSANKKIVSVSKTGTIKRLKRHSKKTKITVTFQNRKFYLYIK
ncbi:MAG: Ig-like domain-containing protein, partial [Eubacterium sp.]|nr:Ig-like domain-containing protein [Eubacterium sp.]